MIHHISIDAQRPFHVATVLAEIWQGKVYQFFVPESYLVMPFDSYGTHVVIFKAGDVWVPGVDAEPAQILQTAPTQSVATHAAISVPLNCQQLEKIGQRQGWRVLTRRRQDGVPFSAVEVWVENRILFEFFPPEFLPEYLQTMQPVAMTKILGQAIEKITV